MVAVWQIFRAIARYDDSSEINGRPLDQLSRGGPAAKWEGVHKILGVLSATSWDPQPSARVDRARLVWSNTNYTDFVSPEVKRSDNSLCDL